MKFLFVILIALFVIGTTHGLWSQSVVNAQSTSPEFSYEESYQFPGKYEAYKRKKDLEATVYDKEFYVGKFGNEGYLAVTRDEGAYDFSRPDPRGPSGSARFRLKVPF